MNTSLFFRSLPFIFTFAAHLSGQIVREGNNVLWEGYKRNSQAQIQQKTQYDTNTYLPLQTLSSDEMVNTDCGYFGSAQNYPDVAQDGQGNYLTIWLDERTGLRRVDAQLSDSSGMPIGGIIRISDRYNDWNSQPHVTFNPVTEEYIVAWADNGANILIQRLSRQGVKLGANNTITDQYILNTNNPSIAVAPNGSMMAVWTSQGLNFGSNPLYCRLLDREGRGKGSSFTIMSPPSDHMSSYGWEKKIAGDSLGRFLVVWSSYINNRNRIIVQAIDTLGTLIGTNANISDPADTIHHYFPTVTGLNNGRFLVAWQKDGGDVGARVYSIDSGIISAQISLSNKRKGQYTIGVTSNMQDRFVAAYSGWTNNSAPHGIVVLNGNGIVIDSSHFISEPYFSSGWTFPNLTTVRNNFFYLSYFGYLKREQDVIVQKFRMPVFRSGAPVKMGNDACSSHQLNPITAVNQFGESIVVWEDGKTSSPCLVGQIYNPRQQPVGGNFIISDTALIAYASNAGITVDSDGSFIVSYSGGAYWDKDLFVRRVLRTGAMPGGNINITNQPYYASAYKAVIRAAAEERYVIVWYNLQTQYSFCNYQILDRDLRPSSSQKQLLAYSAGSPKWIIDIAMNAKNDILLLWTDMNMTYNTRAYGMKAMMFNGEGKSVSDTIRVHSLGDSRWYMSAACYLDDDRNMLFAYSEFELLSYAGALNFRRMYADGATEFTSIDVSSTYPQFQIAGFRNKKSFVSWYLNGNIRGVMLDDDLKKRQTVQLRRYPNVFASWFDAEPGYSIAVTGDTLLLAYADVNDSERGYDIMRTTQRFENFDFEKSLITDSATVEKISLVYPNPNKGMVTMAYQIITPLYVDISVYNILGQRVGTVVAGFERTGLHYATFDTRSLPSGVYFFYYKGYKVYTQKFIVTH